MADVHFKPVQATLAGNELEVTVPLDDESTDKFVKAIRRGKELFAYVTVRAVESVQELEPTPRHPEQVAFEQHVQGRQAVRTPEQAAEVDNRAAPSLIIAQHVAEHAENPEEPTGAEYLQAVVRYLDYQRSQLHVERPAGEAGDVVWHVLLRMSNPAIAPEKAMVEGLLELAKYQIDLYRQNAVIRRRLAHVLQTVEQERSKRDQERVELLGIVQQLEQAARVANPAWQGLEVDAALRVEIDSIVFVRYEGLHRHPEKGDPT